MLILMSMLLIISSIMMLMAMIISKKTFIDREKNSPFECGFDPYSSSRMPFSIQFFIITIIFIIFDVEIAILIPFLTTMKLYSMNNLLLLLFFILILMMGLYYEWLTNALNWSY